MPEKSFVFAEVPSSTRLKPDSGAGDAVNANDVEPFGVASLMIVIEPGKMTASAESERSWLPPDPSRSIRRVWYGEPGIAVAARSSPHPPEPPPARRWAMWPPHASTGFTAEAVKVIVIRALLSPANPEPSGYEYALTAV